MLELSGSRIRTVSEELAALILANRDILSVEVTDVSIGEHYILAFYYMYKDCIYGVKIIMPGLN